MIGIRKRISQILDYGIYPEQWDEAFESLDKEGRITHKEILAILKELLIREEARENE